MMIVHLCKETDWQSARHQGFYRTPSLQVEGFIHCSMPEQILAVANHFYPGERNLLLLWIDPDRLTAEVRWEEPAHPRQEVVAKPFDHQPGEQFPHIYGPLNLDAVLRLTTLEPEDDGIFRKINP